MASHAQNKYNATLHIPIPKPLALSKGIPVDARSYYYDPSTFSYRPYNDTAEVNSYLQPNSIRGGNFPIFVKSGSVIQEWMYKDGTADNNLVQIPIISFDTTSLSQRINQKLNITDLPSIPTKLSQLTNDINAAIINDAASSVSTTYSSNKINSLISGSGGGDMLKSVYDPTGVNGDAFDYNNIRNKPTIPNSNTQIANGEGYIKGTDTVSLSNRVNSKLNTSDTSLLHNQIVGKVDKISGMGLSSNDYTSSEKTKLSGIESGAQKNVQSDWNEVNTTNDDYIKNKPDLSIYTKYSDTSTMLTPYVKKGTNISQFINDEGYLTSFTTVPWNNITGKPTFSTVATSGSYHSLIDTPILSPIALSGDYNDLSNRPIIPQINDASASTTSTYSSSKVVSLISASGGGTVSSVGITAPSGFQISGSPITSSGVINLSYASGYSLPTIAKQNSWDAKLNLSDTSSMLIPYTKKGSNISQFINDVPYLKSVDMKNLGNSNLSLSNNRYLNLNGQFLQIDDSTTTYNPPRLFISNDYSSIAAFSTTNNSSTSLDFYPTNGRIFHVSSITGTGYQFNVADTGWAFSTTAYGDLLDINTNGTIKLSQYKAPTNDSLSLGVNDAGQIIKYPISSSLQGENISLLNNDVGYYKPTDTISTLPTKYYVNSQGFLKSYAETDPVWTAAKNGNTTITGKWNLYNTVVLANSFSFSPFEVGLTTNNIQINTTIPSNPTLAAIVGQLYIQGQNYNVISSLQSIVGFRVNPGGTLQYIDMIQNNNSFDTLWVFNNSGFVSFELKGANISSSFTVNLEISFSNQNYFVTSVNDSPIPGTATQITLGTIKTIATQDWMQSQNYLKQSDLHDSLTQNALDVLFPLALNVTNKTLSADTTLKDSSLVNYRQMKQYVSTNTPPTYVLPTASTTTLGGVKVDGTTVTINGSGVISSVASGSGSVTSVGLSAPAGFSVSGSPVTTSGTLALSFASGYSLPTIANQTSWTNKVNISDSAAMLAPYAFKSSLGQYKLNSDSTSLTGYVSHNSLNTTLAGKIIMNAPTDSISLSVGGIDSVLGVGNFTTKSLALGKATNPLYTLDVSGSLHFNSGVSGDSSFIRSGRYPGGSPFVRLGVGVTNQGGVTEILSDSSGLYLITPAGGRISFNSNGTVQIPFYTNTDSLATFTTDANGSLILRSGVYRSIKTISATSYSLLPSDFTIIFAGTANTTFTLPNPTTCKGRVYRIENRATSGIDISVNYNLYENLTTTINSINSAAGYEIQSDGTNWWIIDTDTI